MVHIFNKGDDMIEDSIAFYSKEELENWFWHNGLNCDFTLKEICDELNRREIIEDIEKELLVKVKFYDLDGLEDYDENIL
jgi:hypothetical protein